MFRIRFPLMEEAPVEGGASGGAPATPTATPAATPANPAAPASALAGGAPPETPAVTPTVGDEWLAEKYRVKKEDGTLDLDASARKVEAARSELEKKLGSGGAAPKTPEEYAVTVPDTLKDKINLEEDAFYKETRGTLHGLGLSQKQFEGVMEQYWKIAPALVGAGNEMTSEKCTADLNALWTDPSARTANFKHAMAATTTISNVAGVKMEDLDAAGLTNNPTFIRLMAAIGPEFSEDKTEAGSGTVLASEGSIKELMMSDAYKNDKDPKHAETVAKVRAYHNRQHGAHPVV